MINNFNRFWSSDEKKPALPPKKHRITQRLTHSPILLEEDPFIHESIDDELQSNISVKELPETRELQKLEPKEEEEEESFVENEQEEVVLRRKSKVGNFSLSIKNLFNNK